MSRSNWRVVLATVGFLIVILGFGSALGWVLWPGSPDLPDYGWQETAYSEYQPGGRSCEPSQINRLTSDAERARKREACEESAEQHRIQTNDLKQQTRAADAAAAAVWIAEWQSKATVFGLIVGFYTLAAAAAAAFYAKDAAQAAKDAVAETRRIGEAQVRCYLSMTTAVIEIAEHALLTVHPVMMNFGQSPAREFRWTHRIHCRSRGKSGFFWTSEPEEIKPEVTGLTFSAGESYPLSGVTADLFLDHAVGDAFLACKRVVFEVRFDMEWEDVFGVKLREQFYYEVDTPMVFGTPIQLKPWQGLTPTQGVA